MTIETEGTETTAAEAAPESVLFPNEADGQPKGETPADQTAGDKPEGEAKPDGEGESKGGDKAADDVVPEDGKYDLAMPEGFEVDQELLAAVGPEFKELGLTKTQAQKLADKFIAVQKERAEKQGEQWAETVGKWAEDAKADKEIGGVKWDATVSAAQRAVKTLGNEGLREYLNASGGGNHPELIRFMAKVGAMIKEDNPAGGGAEGSGKPADAAHILFPSDAPKG